MTPLHVTTLGSGPPLAMVHGWGFDTSVMRPLAERLTPTRTVQLVDLPGHGGSRDMAMANDLPGLAAQLDATLPETSDWIGWSLGGLACLQLAQMRPNRTRRLVLVATNPRFTAGPDWTDALPATELEAFSDALAVDPAATRTRFAGLVAQGDRAGRDVLRTLRGALDAIPAPAALATGLDLLAHSDLTADADAVPTLWLLGDGDALVPVAVADYLAALTDARVERLPGSGHAPFLSATVRCGDLIGTFMDE
jgi:pimeloyl-[acyl-carrier protein] methyl ester esterase